MSILELNKDSFKASRKFYDDKNYPRGMSRSGDYSINEVTILEKYGTALSELSSGNRAPITAEEEHFVGVCNGELNAETAIEKTWLKYQNKILTPKQFHTLFGRSKVDSNVEDEPADLDDLED